MERAAYHLLKLVESYAVHTGDTVCKVLEPAFGGNVGFAFDVQQLLDGMTFTGAKDVELIRDVLLQVNQIHEELVGPVARVNFISYVALHTYHALAQAASSSGNNVNKSTSIFTDPGTSNIEEIDVECCAKFMLGFIEMLRTKGHNVDPRLVMTEIGSEEANEEDKVVYSGFDLSSLTLCSYLSRTFSHDIVSKGYEAGRLAVDCFLIIRSRLYASSAAFQEEAALHTLVKQMVHIVREDDDAGGWMTGGKGLVIPGVAFLSLMRIDKNVDFLPGSCVISPLDAFERLCSEEEHYVDIILLFTRFEKSVSSEHFQRLATLVESIDKGVVVIVIQDHVETTVFRTMESFGNAGRTVLVTTSVDETSMVKLSLAFRIMPRALGSLHMDKSSGMLRLKSLFSHDSYRRQSRMDLKRVLFVLSPLAEKAELVKETPEVYVSVLLGGRCHADCTLLERAFSHQLHHLVNLLCLPSPLNVVVPACGTSEACFIAYIDEVLRLHKPITEENIFKTRLLMALRDATVAYLETFLQKSFGLTAADAIERISISRQRFSKAILDAENKDCHVKLFPRCVGTGSVLYRNVIPTPPFLISANHLARSNVLLADITEWEAQVEVNSAFLSIVGVQKTVGAEYKMNVHSSSSCNSDNVQQSKSHMRSRKEELPSPYPGSQSALCLRSLGKKGVKEAAFGSSEKRHSESQKDKMTTLISYEELVARNGVPNEECGMVSPCGNTEDVKLASEISHSNEKSFKKELFVPHKEEFLGTIFAKGGNSENMNDSPSSGIVCNSVGVLPGADKVREECLFEKSHSTTVLLQPNLLQTERPHLEPRRPVNSICGVPRPPPGKPIPTPKRRETFLVSQKKSSNSFIALADEAKNSLNEGEGMRSSEEAVSAAGSPKTFSKLVISRVPNYLSEDIDKNRMGESAVKKKTEESQSLEGPCAESMYESSFSGTHSYDSNSESVSGSCSSTLSSSSSGSTSSLNSLNSVEAPVVLPFKVGCVEDPPFRAFLDLHYRFAFRNLLRLHAEPAVFYEWSTLDGRWKSVQTSVVIFPTPFARGNMRTSYYVIDLNRLNSRMVGKRYLRSSVEEKQYFDDVSMHSIANHWARRFNNHRPPKTVNFLPAAVMELTARSSPMIFAMEPQLRGEFIKYNNNDGYVPRETRWTPQAFSHFTYHASKGKLIIVDIQGVEDVYTDPQILTLDGEGYGRGNLGRKGMRRFLRNHRCNEVCAKLGLPRMIHGRGGESLHGGYPNTPAVHPEVDSLEILPPKSHKARTASTSEMYKTQVPHSPHMFLSQELEPLPQFVGHLQNTPVAGRVHRPLGIGYGFMKRIRLLLSRRIFSKNYNSNQALRTEKDCEANIYSHTFSQSLTAEPGTQAPN